MKVDVINIKGEKQEEIELPDEIFAQPINENTIYEATKAYLANQRQGTVKTKTRGEVSGSGRKPWRQKGTGRARVGSIRSPLWRKGGVVFGPVLRSYKIKIPKKIKKIALISSLSLKAKEGKIMVLDSLEIKKGKTKIVAGIISKLSLKKPLFILHEKNPNFTIGLRNIPNIHSVLYDNLCSYYVLSHNEIVLTKKAVDKLKEKLVG
ncbi:TPA: 50S ribosomal protein L4 [bacterium]|nr:50S ribosomal protein L4 [bacterium]